MDKLFTLSEETVKTLRQIEDWWKRRQDNIPARPYVPPVVPQAPDIYLALTPFGGVPGMTSLGSSSGTGMGSESIPGAADCEIYRIEQGGNPGNNPIMYRVTDDGFTQYVYNLSTERMPGGVYVKIMRDKFGAWVAINEDFPPEPGSGSGVEPGYCQLASLQHSDCIGVYGPEGSVILTWSGTATASSDGGMGIYGPTGPIASGSVDGAWTSVDDLLSYPDGRSGTVAFWFAGGSAHLSIGGLELLNCGDGCFTGGPLTGHEPPGSGTGSNAGTCSGLTFTVCVQCIECPSTVSPCSGCTSNPSDPSTNSSTLPSRIKIVVYNNPGLVATTLYLEYTTSLPALFLPYAGGSAGWFVDAGVLFSTGLCAGNHWQLALVCNFGEGPTIFGAEDNGGDGIYAIAWEGIPVTHSSNVPDPTAGMTNPSDFTYTCNPLDVVTTGGASGIPNFCFGYVYISDGTR